MGNDEKDIKPNAPAQQAGGDNNADRHGGGGNQRNNWHRWQQGRHGGTPFKGKTKEIAEIFDNTGQHDAATFNKLLKNITDHLELELGNNFSEAVRNMTDTKITIPATPTPKPDPKDSTVMIPPSDINIFQWKCKFTKASDCLDKYEENTAKAYMIIYHQCTTPNLKNELEASDKFPAIRDSQDVIALLPIIQGLCCSYVARIQSVMATIASHKRLFSTTKKMASTTTPTTVSSSPTLKQSKPTVGLVPLVLLPHLLHQSSKRWPTATPPSLWTQKNHRC